ncbi:MAG: 3-deoxy-7-phosphoheptulonate synthase [Myxococcaceae bacterium]|nr:3-deoxy-7-phosphoheptulonate synthase [Myxococcaceae bacterium]
MAAPSPDAVRKALSVPGQAGRVVRIGPVEVGAGPFVVMAGPCAVESGAQVEAAARAVARAGAHVLRGGAFKPRTSPYAFQGLGEAGLTLLAQAARANGLPVITEVMSEAQLPVVCAHADVLQIGARNMQNFSLLKAVAQVNKPVLLKRGLSATLDEWLLAAEYVLAGGNGEVMLCERGIRTFEPALRNTLDLGGVAWVKRRSPLPVVVDPSHATGDAALVLPLALAAAAAGADGLLVEVHPAPESALCDGAQALTPAAFSDLMSRLGPLLQALGRQLAAPAAPALGGAA